MSKISSNPAIPDISDFRQVGNHSGYITTNRDGSRISKLGAGFSANSPRGYGGAMSQPTRLPKQTL